MGFTCSIPIKMFTGLFESDNIQLVIVDKYWGLLVILSVGSPDVLSVLRRT
jgi:hypothetical protein